MGCGPRSVSGSVMASGRRRAMSASQERGREERGVAGDDEGVRRRTGEEAAVEAHERTATGLGVGHCRQAKEGHGLRVVGDDDYAGHEGLDGGDHVLDERLVAKAEQRLGRAHFANARPHSAAGAARQHDARDVVVARHGYAPLRAGVQVTIAVRLGDTPLTV